MEKRKLLRRQNDEEGGFHVAHETALVRMNWVCFLVHLGTSITQFVLASRNKIELSVTTYLTPLPSNNMFTYVRPTEEYFRFSIAYAMASFLALSTLNHGVFLVRYYAYNRTKFMAEDLQGVRWVQWWEYFFSAPLMLVCIMLLSGGQDIQLLICIFGLTATTMLFGIAAEYVLKESPKMALVMNLYGCIPFLFAWSMIAWSFFWAIDHSSQDVPDWITAIVPTLFLLTCVFEFIQVYEIYYRIRGTPVNPVKIAIAYCVASLVAKQVLAWTVNIGGTREPA